MSEKIFKDDFALPQAAAGDIITTFPNIGNTWTGDSNSTRTLSTTSQVTSISIVLATVTISSIASAGNIARVEYNFFDNLLTIPAGSKFQIRTVTNLFNSFLIDGINIFVRFSNNSTMNIGSMTRIGLTYEIPFNNDVTIAGLFIEFITGGSVVRVQTFFDLKIISLQGGFIFTTSCGY